jgi:hypothetical protein
MSGEPIKPKSAEELSERRKAGSLPETRPSASDDVAAFVAKARAMSPHAAGSRGRLVFALDATMSRQPTWDMACALQADMFHEAAALGSLDIRLVYYRGLNECRATGWISDSAQLAKLMGKIDCRGGNTQIGKVLSEARREAATSGVRAVVFVGDAMEERVDDLCVKAGELGLLKVPVFMFQEGEDSRSGKSRASPVGRGAGSILVLRRNCANCCAPPRPMPPAGARRCCGCRKPEAARPNCLAR